MDRFRWCSQEHVAPAVGERVICQQEGVRLYNGAGKTTFEDGRATLTTHRIIWQHGSTAMALPLAAISTTSLQPQTSILGGLGRSGGTPKIVLRLITSAQLLLAFKAMPSRPVWAESWVVDRGDSRVAMAAGLDFVRLGFAQQGQGAFEVDLNAALEAKQWMVACPRTGGAVGLAGIERTMAAQTVSADRSISGAFSDLSKLMERAGEMVNLSKQLSQRMHETKASGGEVAEDETVELRMAMLSMGLREDDDESNQSSSSSHTASSFHGQLATQVCRLLAPLLKQRAAGVCGGCIDLTTAYCRINRARGVQLIAPEDLLEAAKLMPRLKLPLRLKTFPSGLVVLQLASESEEATLEATCKLIPKTEGRGGAVTGMTAGELARRAGIAPVLARERLLLCEERGFLCRDDTELGLAFFHNVFLSSEPEAV